MAKGTELLTVDKSELVDRAGRLPRWRMRAMIATIRTPLDARRSDRAPVPSRDTG